jgi:hypothetical protein
MENTMAGNKQDPVAPVVTSLPLPSSDSVLVIDLPDGQKLLVGKMEHGTVIEVATWRGTGRPDSRTNRLMLGMSNADEETSQSQSTSSEELEYDKRSIRYWIWIIKVLFSKVRDLVLRQTSKLRDKKSENPEEVRNTDVQADVDAWLESVIAKGESKPKAIAGSQRAKASPSKSEQKVSRKPVKATIQGKKRKISKGS